ncbi:ABC transporter permease [Micromonosporaceae bacterium Da 78-11]
MLILLALMVRRHRVLIASWLVLLVALTSATVSAYQSTYSTPQQRRTATDLAQHDAATTLMYGHLADPGSAALMFAWEIGAITTILAAVMAVLVAVALTRAAEDDGTLELVRTTGIDARVPLRSALVILGGVAVVLALGCTAGVGLAVGHVDAVTWSGAAAFGTVVGLTFLTIGILAVVLAQVAATAGGARVLGFAAVGVAFGIRALADIRHAGWLNWLTPLGLRATVRPFAESRWWPLAASLVVVVALAWFAVFLAGRREYHAGLIRRRDLRGTRLNIHSCLGLTARLARQPILTWTVGVACFGTLFSAMGSGVVQQSQQDDLGGFLGSQLGTGNPVAGYFGYLGTIVGMAVTSFAVLGVLRARQDELGGLTDHVLATGVRRWAPLAGQVAVTAAGTLVILVVTGLLSALIAPTVMDGSDVAVRAFTYIIGQWPATMVAAGWTAFLIGFWPRWTWLAWLPVTVGGVLALLGQLVGIPQSVRDFGIFQHVPDIASPSPDIRGLCILLAVSAAASLLGLAGITRRNIITG